MHLLIPMLAHEREIKQTLALIDQARVQLDNRGMAYGPIKLGAMIEVPAAALSLPLFLRHFDFLSIGTNDLIQYTLAIDRADEQVAHLYDPLHPAILQLVAQTIAQGAAAGKEVSLCGEMAGDTRYTRLLLGLGLLIVIMLVIRHSARASVFTGLFIAVAADDPPRRGRSASGGSERRTRTGWSFPRRG